MDGIGIWVPDSELTWTTFRLTTFGHLIDMGFAAGCNTGDSRCKKAGKITKTVLLLLAYGILTIYLLWHCKIIWIQEKPSITGTYASIGLGLPLSRVTLVNTSNAP